MLRHVSAPKGGFFAINENEMLLNSLKHVDIEMPIDQLVRNVLNFVLRVVIECFSY